MSKPKKKQVNPNSLVCNNCGSKKVQYMAWVDANTLKYIDSPDESDTWCNICEDHVKLTTFKEFKENQNE